MDSGEEAALQRRVDQQGRMIDSVDARQTATGRDVRQAQTELVTVGKRLDAHAANIDTLQERVGELAEWRASAEARMQRTDEVLLELKGGMEKVCEKQDACVAEVHGLGLKLAGWMGKNAVIVSVMAAVGAVALGLVMKKAFGL